MCHPLCIYCAAMGCSVGRDLGGWDDDEERSAVRLARLVREHRPARYPELTRVAEQLAADSTGVRRFTKT